MKSIQFFLYIILITWKIVDCEKDDARHVISDDDLIEETEEDTEYVDPYSFDYDRANKKMLARHTTVSKVGKSTGSNDVCISDGQCREELKQCQDALGNFELDRLFTARLINLLLSSAKLEEKDDLLTGSITLSGDKIQIEELRQFSDGKITLRQVDSILSNIIKPRKKAAQEVTLDFINRLHIVTHEYKGTLMAVSAVVVVFLLYKYVDWSIGKIISAFLIFGFIMSYFMMWQQLIREAELKQYVKMNQNKNRPIDCDPEEMSYLEWLTRRFDFSGKNKCNEYMEAIHLDASHAVNPIDPLLELFDKVVFRFGSAMGGFIDNATQNLGFPMRTLMTPFLFLLIPLLVFCYFVPLRLWFGPFCGVAVGGGQRNETRREKSAIDQKQPPMIEQRQPITQIHITYDNKTPIVSVRNSEAETRILGPTSMAIESNTSEIGSGDTETRRQEARQETSGAMCISCCCKNSLNSPHIEEDRDLKDEKSENEVTENEVRSGEKGDGDC